LCVFSNLSPDPGVEKYFFDENERGEVEFRSEKAADCAGLCAAEQTKKGFLSVPFTVHGQRMLLVNLHLSPSRQRRKQEKEILLTWLKTRPPSWSIVLAGDFNEDLCARQSLRRTWQGHRLKSLTCSVGATVGGFRKGIWQGAFFGGQLDHILVRGAFQKAERRRVFRHAQDGLHFSDHDGVWGRWVPNP
jgi:endonuclease/exonuclease/phosphatase family metal-dependent hydrolase